MLWIFVLAIIMPISLVTCENSNLTAITWRHAVNSHAELEDALKGRSHFEALCYIPLKRSCVIIRSKIKSICMCNDID